MFAITPYAVATLGLAAYGLWALVSVLVRFAMLADFGLGPSLTKYTAEHAARNERERVRGVITAGALYYLGLGCAIVPLAYVLGPFLIPMLHLAPELRAQAPAVLVGAVVQCAVWLLLWSTLSSLVNGLGHLRVTAAAGAVGQIAGAVTSVALLVQHVGIWSMIFGSYAQVLVQCAIVYVYARRTFGPVFVSPFSLHRSVFGALFRFGAWIQVSTIAGLLGVETVTVIVGVSLGVETVALLDLGSRIARAVRVLAYHLNTAFLPAMAAHEAEHGTRTAQRALADVSRYAALISFGATGLLVAVAPVAPRAWLGGRAPGAASIALVVTFLALTYLTDNVVSVAATSLRAIGKPWVETAAAVVYALANVGLVAVLAPYAGLPGVLAGMLASSVLSALVFFATFARVRSGALDTVIGAWTLRLFAACALAACAGVVAGRLIPAAGRPSAIVAVLVASAAYALVLVPALRAAGFLGARDLAFAQRLLPMRAASMLDSRAARSFFGAA